MDKQEFVKRHGGKFNLIGTRWTDGRFEAVRESGAYRGSYIWSIRDRGRFHGVVGGDETDPLSGVAAEIEGIRGREDRTRQAAEDAERKRARLHDRNRMLPDPRPDREGAMVRVAEITGELDTMQGRQQVNETCDYCQGEKEVTDPVFDWGVTNMHRTCFTVWFERGTLLSRLSTVPKTIRQRVQQMRKEGLAPWAVAERLNSEGIPAGRAGAPWGPGTVDRLLADTPEAKIHVIQRFINQLIALPTIRRLTQEHAEEMGFARVEDLPATDMKRIILGVEEKHTREAEEAVRQLEDAEDAYTEVVRNVASRGDWQHIWEFSDGVWERLSYVATLLHVNAADRSEILRRIVERESLSPPQLQELDNWLLGDRRARP